MTFYTKRRELQKAALYSRSFSNTPSPTPKAQTVKIKYQVATALDFSLDAAVAKRGIYTDKVRVALAAYLDGAVKLKVKTVRAMIRYLVSCK